MEHNIKLVYSSQEIMQLFNIHQSTLFRWLKKGTFPPPDIKLNAKSKFWRKTTIDSLFQNYAEQKLLVMNK